MEKSKKNNKSKNTNTILQPIKKDRRIYIIGNITNFSVAKIIARLDKMDSVSHEDIEIVINSPGGDIYSAFNLIDVIKDRIKSDVRTTVIGSAYSSASLISICGAKNKRSATKNSVILFHQSMSTLMDGNKENFKSRLNFLRAMDKKIISHITKHTCLFKYDLIDLMNMETKLTPKIALMFNAIDFII